MTTTTHAPELTLQIVKTSMVKAPLDVTFQAVLDQLGTDNERPDGEPMPMTLEPRPGGRWFRDLGDDNGHLWGHVQVIKPPTLLEITGPLFMSYPVISHIQWRLEPSGGGTEITLHHRAFGMVEPAHREGVAGGWAYMLDKVRHRAE